MEPSIGVCLGHPRSVATVPDAPPGIGDSGRLRRAGASFHQMPVQETGTFFLADHDGPQPAARMRVIPPEFVRSCFGTNSEICDPSLEIFVQSLHASPQRFSPASSSQLQNPGGELRLRLGRYEHLDVRTAVGSKAKSQEVNPLRLGHRTLRLIDLEPQSALQKTTRRSHDPFPGSLAPHEDITVIGVAHEPESTAFQLPVPFVQDDISRSLKYGRNLNRADVKPITCTASFMTKKAISATCSYQIQKYRRTDFCYEASHCSDGPSLLGSLISAGMTRRG